MHIKKLTNSNARSKESLSFRVVKKLPKATDKRILSDQLVVLNNKDSRANYPKPMRLIRALVEVDGKEREVEFLTNNLSWSAGSVADLYRCRWQIEVFFKQIKQSLQLCDFLGNSANAVRWQVWTALLLYVLMRFLCVLSSWNHSFTRLFTLLRAALWRKIDLWDSIQPTDSEKSSSQNRETLKPTPQTIDRKPASIQELRSYSCALWDHNGSFWL